MNQIRIDDIRMVDNAIFVSYIADGEVATFFKHAKGTFIASYSLDVSDVPESVALLPLIANVLPLVWVCDATLIAPSLDKSFADSLDNIKRAYKDMYPNMTFAGKLEVAETIANSRNTNEGSILFYSGGVDSACSLIRHLDECPMLFTLWGSDVMLDNTAGWNEVKRFVSGISDLFDLESIWASSNFREMFNESALNTLVGKSGDFWWHGFQHGIGIITHAAPIAFKLNKSVVYFASSYCAEDVNVKCASYPTIDESTHFCDCDVIHDGFELNRQQKAHALVEKYRSDGLAVPLRVCWVAEDGKNCGHCEKCWRTILELYAEGVDPSIFGFEVNSVVTAARGIRKHFDECLCLWEFYVQILETLHRNYTNKSVNSSLQWFYELHANDLHEIGPHVKSSIKDRDARYAELHAWTDELQKAKDWLAEQYECLTAQNQ